MPTCPCVVLPGCTYRAPRMSTPSSSSATDSRPLLSPPAVSKSLVYSASVVSGGTECRRGYAFLRTSPSMRPGTGTAGAAVAPVGLATEVWGAAAGGAGMAGPGLGPGLGHVPPEPASASGGVWTRQSGADSERGSGELPAADPSAPEQWRCRWPDARRGTGKEEERTDSRSKRSPDAAVAVSHDAYTTSAGIAKLRIGLVGELL